MDEMTIREFRRILCKMHAVNEHGADITETFTTLEDVKKLEMVATMFAEWSPCEMAELATGLTEELAIRQFLATQES